MAVSSKHILHQGPVIASMGRAILQSALQSASKNHAAIVTPGQELTAHLPPRPRDLVAAYARHVGADPASYRKVLPPHLFPQWAFPLATRTLFGIPYPLQKVMNGGCRLESRGEIPIDQPLVVRARLEEVDDDGRRAVLHQRVATGTESDPEALIAHLYAVVPIAEKTNRAKAPAAKREKPRVPDDVREIAYWRIGRRAGLEFAKLTGDFNPVHWIRPYARASGFPSVILHGFSTMARAWEGLRKTLAHGERIGALDVKFTRPLVLPARAGLYRDAGRGVFVGDALGGPAYLQGSFEIERSNGGPRT